MPNVVRAAPGPFAVIGDQCGTKPDGVPRCTRPSTVRNTAACVHEHVSTGVCCAEHAGWLAGATWLCEPCLDLGHECPVTVVLEQEKGAATVVAGTEDR